MICFYSEVCKKRIVILIASAVRGQMSTPYRKTYLSFIHKNCQIQADAEANLKDLTPQ
jgi:hypothetical protein